MDFEIVGSISAVETIAVGRGIRDRRRLNRIYGQARWRKRKGFAFVRLTSREAFRAEIHWYEASGIGRGEHKIKRRID